jgi:predicted ATPase
MTSTRKLAAIMFTDIKDFTSLMQKDEMEGVQKRRTYFETLKKHHQDFNGEIVNMMGDGSLSIFSNASDAVECGIKIQHALLQDIPVRIGIHAGTIIIEEEGVVGDAVNIASRIESFGYPGTIMVSDFVHDQIKNQPHLDFVYQGEFELKNIDRPYQIYAISVPGIVVPEVGSLSGKGQKLNISTPIPEYLTPLLGRDTEVVELNKLLLNEQIRVITILGPGGIGKTRLSAELCKQQQINFPDGIAFVDLTAIDNENEVLARIAEALMVKEAEGRDHLQGLVTVVGKKRVLLVLDNMEHVIEASKELSELISACPNVKILTTSQVPLKISSEYEYRLSPLSLPSRDSPGSVEDLLNYPSISLFKERAIKVKPDFQLTSENTSEVISICNQMDGLPLALELAAARIRILSPKDLLKRLDRALDVLTTGSRDLPKRHQTLRATIDWSYSLLDDSEKCLLRRLAIFSGGFVLESIESVCCDDGIVAPLDDLQSLVEKGLVFESDSGRFDILQMIKEYSLEQLESEQELEKYRRRHAEHIWEIVKDLNIGTQGNNELYWMKRGIQEEPNIQTALEFLKENADAGEANSCEIGLDICGEIITFWHIRGKNVSAGEWSLAFLDSPSCPEKSHGKCKALITLALAQWMLGHFENSLKYAQAAHDLAVEFDYTIEKPFSALNVFISHMTLGNMELAFEFSEYSVREAEKLETKYWLCLSLMLNGMLNLVGERFAQARASYERGMDLLEDLEDYETRGGMLGGLAALAVTEGNIDKALELYHDSLKSYATIGDRAEEARILEETAWTYLIKNDYQNGRKYFLECIQAFKELGSTRGIGQALIGVAASLQVAGNSYQAVMVAETADILSTKEGIINAYGGDFKGKDFIEKARIELSVKELEKASEEGKSMSLDDLLDL